MLGGGLTWYGCFRLQASPVSLGLHRSRFALRAWLLCGMR
jgi:hypothetical protein